MTIYNENSDRDLRLGIFIIDNLASALSLKSYDIEHYEHCASIIDKLNNVFLSGKIDCDPDEAVYRLACGYVHGTASEAPRIHFYLIEIDPWDDDLLGQIVYYPDQKDVYTML